MVLVGIEVVVVILLLIFSIGLQIEARFSARDHLEGYDDALEEMRQSLTVVAAVLQKLPDLVPQFSINQNPLSQLLEFFQARSAQQGSLDAERLRNGEGRYSDGETQSEQETDQPI